MSQCPKCKKVIVSKVNLNYHIENDLCKVTNFECEYCDKRFTTKQSRDRHIKNSCKKKQEIDNNIIDQRDKQEILDMLLKMKDEMDTIKQENRDLKKYVKTNKGGTVNNSANNVINGDVNISNNVVNNNIVLVGYGKEDLSKVDHADLLKGISMGFNSTLKLIDTVHFNPKYPEFHNVYISSMKNKYAMMYDGNDWTLVMKDYLIDKLYDDKRNYIEENLDEFLNSLTVSQQKALHRWLNVDDDHHYVKKIKNDIKLLLYNKRKLVTALEKNPCGLLDMIEDNDFSQKVIKTPKVSVTTISDNSDKTKVPCVKSKSTKSCVSPTDSPTKQPYSKRRAGRPGSKRKVFRRD